MEYYVMIFILVLCVLVALCILVIRLKKDRSMMMKELLLESEKRHKDDMYAMQCTMRDAFMSFQNQMSNSLKQDLLQLNQTTSEHLYTMQKDVHMNMMQGYDKTKEVFSQVLERMGRMDESQRHLKELSMSITHLQSILTDKKTRGIFGEIELYSLLEMAMGSDQKRYAKQYKLSNGNIVDAALFAAKPLRMICIDSKFPLENYNRILQEGKTMDERKKAQAAFASDVKKHIKAIGDKYIIPQETAEFAYMFIPAEAIFSYLHANCPQIIQYSYERKVYLVSPTTLMAYITAIKAIYLGQQRNEHVEQMQDELKKLQVEFERFEQRYTSVANDFEKCYQDMQHFHITLRKLMQRFKDIEDVKLKEDAN